MRGGMRRNFSGIRVHPTKSAASPESASPRKASNPSGRRESNPHGHFGPTDFKSVASAIPPRPVIFSPPQHKQCQNPKNDAIPAEWPQPVAAEISHEESRA